MAESTSKDDKMTTLLMQGRKYYISKENLAIFAKKGKINMKDLKVSLLKPTIGKNLSMLSSYKEDVLFNSTQKDCNFLQGEYPNLVLKNRLQAVSNANLTIASYRSDSGSTLVKSSKNVAELIGQKNYDLVFSALAHCSSSIRPSIQQHLKLRAMLALLTFDKECSNKCCQTEVSNNGPEDKTLKTYKDSSCQTESDGETDKLVKEVSLKRRIKRKITPFVVKESPVSAPNVKRTVINPNVKDDLKKFFSEEKKRLPTLPDIHLDEDSNASMLSNVSFTNMSVCSELLDNQLVKMLHATDHTIKEIIQVKKDPNSNEGPNSSIFEPNSNMEEPTSNIEQPNSVIEEPNSNLEQPNIERPEIDYNNFIIQTWDGTKVMVPCKPEDQFHLATPYILKHVTNEEKKKLLWHQAFIDWNLCLERDEEDNMPLHLAVMCSDLDLIRRQCLVLKTRAVSMDIKANGMTALEISIRQNSDAQCTRTLVALGADPLRVYREQQTALHLAAEAKGGHVRAVLDGLSIRARAILSEHEELHYSDWQSRSDDELATHLLLQTSFMFDNRGYSPLMLAAKVGNPDNVRALLEKSPETVNTAMPNSGNTALYIAVAEACMHASDTDNKALFQSCDNYLKTVETLLEFGADPEIENSCGTKIGDLLQESNIPSLCQLVANKVTARHFGDAMPSGVSAEAYMLVKNNQGDITIVDNTNEGPKKGKGKQNKAEDVSIEIAGVIEENDAKVTSTRGQKRKKVGVKHTQDKANKYEVKDVIVDGKTERKVLHEFAKESTSVDVSNEGEGSTGVNNNPGMTNKPEMTKTVDCASNIRISHSEFIREFRSYTNVKTGDPTKLVRIAPKDKVGIPQMAKVQKVGIPQMAKVQIPAKPKLQTVPILFPLSLTHMKSIPFKGLGPVVITPLTNKLPKKMPNANKPNADGNVKIMPKPDADRHVKIMPKPGADRHVKIMPNADENDKIILVPALTTTVGKKKTSVTPLTESVVKRKASLTDSTESAVKRKASLTDSTESAVKRIPVEGLTENVTGSKQSFDLKRD